MKIHQFSIQGMPVSNLIRG